MNSQLLKEDLEAKIKEAVIANNDYDGWDIRESFDEQRAEIEAHDTQVIIGAIWPQIEKLHAVAVGINLDSEKIYCEHWPVVDNQCWCQLVREHQGD